MRILGAGVRRTGEPRTHYTPVICDFVDCTRVTLVYLYLSSCIGILYYKCILYSAFCKPGVHACRMHPRESHRRVALAPRARACWCACDNLLTMCGWEFLYFVLVCIDILYDCLRFTPAARQISDSWAVEAGIT